MELERYQKLALRTANIEGKTQEKIVLNALVGLSGELGEVSDVIKKVYFQEHPVGELQKVKEELGDLMWYVALLATALEIDLNDVIEDNIEKLKKRYPNGFKAKDSIERKV